jgi:hypothetical protein
LVFLRLPDCFETGIHSTEQGGCAKAFAGMAKSADPQRLSWPWWAPWALLGVAATSVLTIAATLYDIL